MKNLKRAAIVMASAVAISGGIISPANAQSSLPSLATALGLHVMPSGPVAQNAAHIENETIRLLNDYRVSHGLNRLAVDPGLTAQARDWSQRLADGAATRHSNHNVFENVAMNSQAGPATFFNQWKNSPGHNRNMLEAGVTKVGVGVAFDTAGKAYSTMQLSW
ncbi:CAP domain-containing protein [Corynebacterium hylobatis]|uniref:CAP domain-containing protein n=1 Tax=Corynebacterium hylobatis TaxID=1859290 RepID=A0A430HWQ6_9CORY|nr:CAP domain-containing protein [Corynebacterium hylobatis]RSZ61920.1 CAP domain-containing protein [Corynebacterium hylobatis]